MKEHRTRNRSDLKRNVLQLPVSRQGVLSNKRGETLVTNILKVFAVLLILSGIIWILQGVNILPGSFMTGDPQWAVNGAITVVIGSGLLWFVSRKK